MLPPATPEKSEGRAVLAAWLIAMTAVRECFSVTRLGSEGDILGAVKAMESAHTWNGFMLGLLQGFHLNDTLAEIYKNQTKKAAQKRREKGDITREKIKEIAVNFQHMTRENASFAMADDVNINASSSTIRRYLSKAFPGKMWGASLDAAQQSERSSAND